MLSDLHEAKTFKRMRESSYNRQGGNEDFIWIEPGESHVVPTLVGPGIIRHVWFTIGQGGERVYQDLQLQITFDGAASPQVDVPFADFFLFGHGLMVDVNSGPIQVSRQPHINEKPYRGGLNCMFPMPFNQDAIFTIKNNHAVGIAVFYYIDYEQHQQLDEALYFHATLHEEQTQAPVAQPVQEHGQFDTAIINLSTDENYNFLDVQGYKGHYVGTALSINCKPGTKGKWWEGDDMFVIDNEAWPPRLHGTGTEDYFNLAWGFRQVDCRPEYGITFLEKQDDDTDQIDGRFSMYRFHLHDPIPFTTALHVSIEHGHANDCESHYRSVAFWYGRPLR